MIFMSYASFVGISLLLTNFARFRAGTAPSREEFIAAPYYYDGTNMTGTIPYHTIRKKEAPIAFTRFGCRLSMLR
jgi:hypothetical protein